LLLEKPIADSKPDFVRADIRIFDEIECSGKVKFSI